MKKLFFALLFLVGCFFFPFRKCSNSLKLSVRSFCNDPIRVDTFVLENDSFLVFLKHVNSGSSISVVPFSSFKTQK